MRNVASHNKRVSCHKIEGVNRMWGILQSFRQCSLTTPHISNFERRFSRFQHANEPVYRIFRPLFNLWCKASVIDVKKFRVFLKHCKRTGTGRCIQSFVQVTELRTCKIERAKRDCLVPSSFDFMFDCKLVNFEDAVRSLSDAERDTGIKGGDGLPCEPTLFFCFFSETFAGATRLGSRVPPRPALLMLTKIWKMMSDLLSSNVNKKS